MEERVAGAEASGEKAGDAVRKVGKHWVLKALYDVKIYPQNNGELLRSFQEGSDMTRFSL